MCIDIQKKKSKTFEYMFVVNVIIQDVMFVKIPLILSKKQVHILYYKKVLQ